MILVTYDVSTESAEGRRRLRQVAKTCEDFGQRVQKSVFECQVDEKHLHRLQKRLMDVVNEKEDSLRFYRINEPVEEHIETYGRNDAIDFEDTLVI